MGTKVLQICPCPPEVRIAWYNEGKVDLHKPTCIALIERGTTQEIVYMETVDNIIERVDNENDCFMGFLEVSDHTLRDNLQDIAQARYKKELSVKPK